MCTLSQPCCLRIPSVDVSGLARAMDCWPNNIEVYQALASDNLLRLPHRTWLELRTGDR